MSNNGPKESTTRFLNLELLVARSSHQQPLKQGLSEAVFEFDEALTHWSPEKPPKPVLTASPTRKVNEKRNEARINAINAIAHARHNLTIAQPRSTVVPVAAQEVGFVVPEVVQAPHRPRTVRKLF